MNIIVQDFGPPPVVSGNHEHMKYYMTTRCLFGFMLLFMGLGKGMGQNFQSSLLNNLNINNPTSLQFGPDGRLYVSEQYGTLHILTIQRVSSKDYRVTDQETYYIMQQTTPNHEDDGSLHGDNRRQVTGILVVGTPENPVMYVSSSDYRIGAGTNHTDKNLDTNSGIISRFTWTGSKWDKVDLVRGLPRSEENHASNGMVIVGNTMYLAQGGHTNAGAPSNNFARTTEFALSAAVLSIDLAAIDNMPLKTQTINGKVIQYKYDIPTLDDPTRPNANGISDPNTPGYDGIDVNDPFGGNDGLNQAKWVENGPVQVYATGFRNIYDLLITRQGNMYTWDNGPNSGWGGHPKYEGTGQVTTEYIGGEPGSTGPGPNDPKVNNLDGLHHVTAGYYGGHPNPLRANPTGAGLYKDDAWYAPNDTRLPVDWPPVPTSFAHTIEGNYQNPGETDQSLITIEASTNGICEYTASGELSGSILAAAFNDKIFRVQVQADGKLKPGTGLEEFATGFAKTPLDITAQGDNDIFPGTVWTANYGSDNISVFEPENFGVCSGTYSLSLDEDGDQYTNADEIDNGTNPCSAASIPDDFDKTFLNGYLVSNLNDPDDDDDGIMDDTDVFPWDPDNGMSTLLPIDYPLLNGEPGFGFYGLGFTGLMSNGEDYLTLIRTEENSSVEIIAGGAVGLFTINNVSGGDATGTMNNQENGYQFGINVDKNTPRFRYEASIQGPLFSNTPENFQSAGIYIGTGGQDDYLKMVISANGGNPNLEVVMENGGVSISSQYSLPNIGTAPGVRLAFSVSPDVARVQPYVSVNNGPYEKVGPPLSFSGTLRNTLQSEEEALAIGIISTNRGASSPFNATWDHLAVRFEATDETGSWSWIHEGDNCQPMGSAGSCPEGRHEASYVQVGDKFYLLGGREHGGRVNIYDPASKTWSLGANPPFGIHHFQAIDYHGLLYVVGAFKGGFPNETPVPNILVYDPALDTWKTGPEIPANRRRGAAGLVVYQDKLYLVSGIINGHVDGWVTWLDEYDPVTNTWKELPDAPRARDHFHAAVLDGQLVAVAGRRTGEIGVLGATEGKVDVYNFSTQKWTTLSNDLPTKRAGNTVAVLNQEVIVIGGEINSGPASKKTEALSLDSGEWRTLADMQQGRHGTQAIVNNSGIYMASGSPVGGGGSSQTQEVFFFNEPQPPVLPSLVRGSMQTPEELVFTPNQTQILNIFHNNGTQGIFVEGVDITGSDTYSLVGEPNFPLFLRPGATLALQVKRGTAAGTATLNIQHSGQNGPQNTVLLTPVGQSPQLTANPYVYYFQNTVVGATSAPQDFTLTNSSNAALTLTNVNLEGTHANEFNVSLNAGSTVPANGTLSFTVTFSPQGANPNIRSASLVLTHSGSNSPLTIALNGETFTSSEPTEAICINAGSNSTLTLNGDIWEADQYFDGGGTFTAAVEIEDTNIDPIYQSERFGEITYEIPLSGLAGEELEVELHFAEIYFTDPGVRVFDVLLEGEVQIEALDVVQATGGRYKAYVQKFTLPRPEDNKLSIAIQKVKENPKISGIKISAVPSSINQAPIADFYVRSGPGEYEVVVDGNRSSDPENALVGFQWEMGDGSTGTGSRYTHTFAEEGPFAVSLKVLDDQGATDTLSQLIRLPALDTTSQQVWRINSGGPSLTLNGTSWLADQWFEAGTPTLSDKEIEDTLLDSLYQSARTGNFRYRIPLAGVATNRFQVDLFFTETEFTAAGQRVFEVRANDSLILGNMDLIQLAGLQQTYQVQFLVTTSDETELDLSFSSSQGNATLSAIRIEGLDPISTSRPVDLWATGSITFFPNPIQSGTPIQVNSEWQRPQEVSVMLVNMQGQRVYQTHWVMPAGKHSQAIPTRGLSPGPYKLWIYTADGAQSAPTILIR